MPTPENAALIRALEAAHSVVAGHDPALALQDVLDAAIELVQAERGLIVMRSDSRDGTWKIPLARNFGRHGVRDTDVAFSRTLVAIALERGEPIRSTLPEVLERLHGSKSFQGANFFSALAAPLRDGRTAIVLTEKTRAARFSDDELLLLGPLTALASHVFDLVAANMALQRELDQVRNSGPKSYSRLTGSSPAMDALKLRLDRICASDAPVLILGESGTGKEEVARTIHEHGKRAEGPFVPVNVTALPESLLEATLFGHTKGAFTGAEVAREGLFREAEGGTLFLDEIGDMPLALQPKLLRVLQERTILPVGASKPLPVNVRIVAATHRDLEARVRREQFREDLYYRLNVLTVETPRLCDRLEDVPALAHLFLKRFAEQEGKAVPRLGRDALEALERHPWPGNVRELENAIRRAVVLGNDPVRPLDLGLRKQGRVPKLRHGRKQFDREVVSEALEHAKGSVSRAAELVGVSRATMYRLCKRLGVSPGR